MTKMKITLLNSLTMLSVFAVAATTANAIPVSFTDIDRIGIELAQNASTTGNFNIVTGDGDAGITIAGYTAGTNGTFSDVPGYAANSTLTGATAYFYLRDANQGNDAWDINFNITIDFLMGGGTLAGVSQFTHFDTLSGSAFNFLNANGNISYTVLNTGTNNGARFFVEYARLEAQAEVQDPRVPDSGATISLLGLSLIGMAALRRKFTRTK